MPRQRSPNRDKAKTIYIRKKGGIALTEIAKQLGETAGTVRGWKAKDRWDDILNGTLQTKDLERSEKNKKRSKSSERSEKNPSNNGVAKNNESEVPEPKTAETNTKSRSAALIGNKNAYGNKGGKGGPHGNKFAVTTGEYETIFFPPDIVDAEELALMNVAVCKYNEQSRMIKSLRIREMRMYRRIATLKATPGGMVFDSVTKNKSTTTTQYNKRGEDGEVVPGSSNTVTEEGSSHVAVPVLAEIIKIEEALTRVQGRLQRAIELWHRMELDDAKLTIDQSKLDLYRMRITGQIDLDELVGDDDFEGDIDDAL